MENKLCYTAPAVRILAVRYENSFLTSAEGGIDPWVEDDGEVEF